MLEDGSIMDSAMLPEGAVEGHSVQLSGESLLQSMRSPTGSTQGHPLTFSGSSQAASLASLAPGQHADQSGNIQQALEYHPIVVPEADTARVFDGESKRLLMTLSSHKQALWPLLS